MGDLTTCITSEQNRRNGLIFNIPPPRYTPQNPYAAGWTKAQLDMRRKAEVLKYNKSANGRISKAQSWTQIVNGSYQRRTFSGSYLNNVIDINCDKVVTYTTGAGIPGPPTPLYLDPAVPLYNYNSQSAGLGINNKTETDMWRTKYDTNLLSNSPVIYTLNIRPPIDNPRYKFTIKTSVGIYLDGSANANNYTTKVTILPDSIKVMFGGQMVDLQTRQPTITLEPGFKTDISGSLTGGPYGGAFYLGNIVISNLELSTAAGNTYDIVIQPTISALIVGRETNDPINKIQATLYTNLIEYSNDPKTLSNNTKRFGTRITFNTPATASTIVAPIITGVSP
uniref:Uncharacterized protein n=1 Tax=viral metagenome TaxID=1070528 RepID=A0A6C0B7G6_9ZZZZ